MLLPGVPISRGAMQTSEEALWREAGATGGPGWKH
jgi:hypothetical protein